MLGVAQADKHRTCGDLRHSRTNLACIAETPIKLVSWGHLTELTDRVGDKGRDWAFFKADHEAAYKQLPLDYGPAKLAAIALRSPVDQNWYGFLIRTMLFGSFRPYFVTTYSPAFDTAYLAASLRPFALFFSTILGPSPHQSWRRPPLRPSVPSAPILGSY